MSAPQKTDRSLGHGRQVSRSLCSLAKWPPAGAAHLHASAGDTKAYARSHPHSCARARPQFCPLGRQFAQLAPKLRIRKPETGCSADLALPASGDFWNAPRRGPARARRAGRDPAGADTRTSAAPPQRGRQSYLQRARARVCAPTALRSLPCPTVGHAQCARRAGGPFKASAAELPRPSRGPAPTGGVCSQPGRSLCAPPGGGGGGGRVRWDRPAGMASCAPSRISRGPPPSAREKKGGFEGRAGTGRAARPPRCSVPLRPSPPLRRRPERVPPDLGARAPLFCSGLRLARRAPCA